MGFVQAISWLCVLAALLTSPAFPEVGNSIIVLSMIISVLLVATWPNLRRSLPPRYVWLALPAAAALLLVALAFTTKQPDNLLVLLVLSPIWMSIALAALFSASPNRIGPTAVATMALGGVLVATGITGYDALVRGLGRAGELTLNPIHMGDLALMLGFVALVGFFDGRERWRTLFLVGPVLAIVAVYWTGSRGPLVAAVFLVVLSYLYALSLMERKSRMIWAAVGCLGAVTVVAIGIYSDALSQIRGLDHVWTLLTTGSTENRSLGTRIAMYQGAIEAFGASPLFGYGSLDFVSVVAQLSTNSRVNDFDHLHSDLADFAVIGGVLGLACYLLIIATPLVAGLRSAERNRPAAFYLGLVTTVGYATMGLTNAVLGILVLTSLYGVLLALLLSWSTANKLAPQFDRHV